MRQGRDRRERSPSIAVWRSYSRLLVEVFDQVIEEGSQFPIIREHCSQPRDLRLAKLAAGVAVNAKYLLGYCSVYAPYSQPPTLPFASRATTAPLSPPPRYVAIT